MTAAKQSSLVKQPLFIVLITGFILKLLYLFVIGPMVFGEGLLISKDAYSYTDSFINLVNTGQFTFNPSYGPASYGRLPGVTFVWGFFYLLFGKAYSYTAFALFQMLLDILAGIMIFKIISKYFNEKTGIIVCWVYILFPLTFYFIVKTESKYLALFIIIAVFYRLVFFKSNLKNYFVLALLLVMGFYIREILMLLIPLSFIYVWKNFGLNLKQNVFMVFIMLILYLPWPIRNYIKSGEIILVKPLSAGYAEYKEDITSYMYWLYAWHNDEVQDYLEYAYDLKREIIFPKEIFTSEAEKKVAYDAIRLAQRAGSSFFIWQRKVDLKSGKHDGVYDKLITRSFNFLKSNYRRNYPFVYYIKVPFRNLSKAVFKNSLSNPASAPSFIFKVTMLFRTAFLLIGILACFYYWKNDYFKISFLFSAGIYFFICFILRQVEMRYLYQADVIMLIAAVAFGTDWILKRKGKKSQFKQSPKLF